MKYCSGLLSGKRWTRMFVVARRVHRFAWITQKHLHQLIGQIDITSINICYEPTITVLFQLLCRMGRFTLKRSLKFLIHSKCYHLPYHEIKIYCKMLWILWLQGFSIFLHLVIEHIQYVLTSGTSMSWCYLSNRDALNVCLYCKK